MHALSIRAYNTRDISPALKGGASGLTTRVSCFNGGCVRGSHLSMPYAPSTGSKNRESLGQNVFCRIVIALVGGSARGTDPLPHGQFKIGKDMFADRARF